MAIRPTARTGARLHRGWALACLSLVLALALAGCSVPHPTVIFTGATANGKSIIVPARIRHGPNGSTLVIVDLQINGKGPYPFALDTGASLSLLDQQLANQLSLPVAGPPEDITGVGGSQRVTPVNVANWAMGAVKLPARTITSAPIADLSGSAGIVGLLGSDILSAFNSVTIDYANSDIIVTPAA